MVSAISSKEIHDFSQKLTKWGKSLPEDEKVLLHILIEEALRSPMAFTSADVNCEDNRFEHNIYSAISSLVGSKKAARKKSGRDIIYSWHKTSASTK
jgi:hypothetical protein